MVSAQELTCSVPKTSPGNVMTAVGVSVKSILATQNNLAITYQRFGRLEQAMSLKREVYFGRLKLFGEEHDATLTAANNYANSLQTLKRFGEAKSLLRKTMPVARRVLGENNEATLTMRGCFADALLNDPGATLGELREAVTMLAEANRTARRVLGGAHPTMARIEQYLRDARAALAAREGADVSALCDGVAAMTPGGA